MKNLLYIIAGVVVLIWTIVFKPSENIHFLIALAFAIILITVIFDKRLSNK